MKSLLVLFPPASGQKNISSRAFTRREFNSAPDGKAPVVSEVRAAGVGETKKVKNTGVDGWLWASLAASPPSRKPSRESAESGPEHNRCCLISKIIEAGAGRLDSAVLMYS